MTRSVLCKLLYFYFIFCSQVSALEQLVQTHTIAPCYNRKRKAMTQERIDWSSIGRELGRRPRRCSDKWDKIQRATSSTESAMNVTITESISSKYAATACSSASSTSSSTSSSPCSSSDDESSSSSSSGSDSDSDSESESDSNSDSSNSSSSSSQSSTLSQKRSIPTNTTIQRVGVDAESGGAGLSTAHQPWTKEEVSWCALLFDILCFLNFFIFKYDRMNGSGN